MTALSSGTFVFVRYDGDDLWHEQLVVGCVESAEHLVLTPDADLYIEQLDAANGDLAGIRVMVAEELSFGLDQQRLYRLGRRPTSLQLQGILAEGARLRLARTERLARGLGDIALGDPVADRPIGALAPTAQLHVVPFGLDGGRVAMAPGEWVTDEPIPGYPVGSRLDLVPAGLVNLGGRAFATVSGKLATVSFIEAGVDMKAWLAQRTSTLSCGDPRVLPIQDVSRTLTLQEQERKMERAAQRTSGGSCPTTSGGSWRVASTSTTGAVTSTRCSLGLWILLASATS
eukprot:5259019-Amphidinium_carterae.1